MPVGLEKRVQANLHAIARDINSPGANGHRYWVVDGNVITELEAISILSGARAILAAAGGVRGAEGACWIAVSGTAENVIRAEEQIQEVAAEPSF